MTAVDLKVYMVLALHANWTTGECWPSYRTIHDLSGCSRESISGSIRRLVQLGAISFRHEKAHNGRRNVYTVFRTLRPSSGGQSIPTDYPPAERKRDKLGRFQSSRTDDPWSRTTDVPQSSRTDQNYIHLNESNRTRSKEPPPPPPTGGNGQASETSARPVLTISEGILREFLKIKTKAQVRDMLNQGNYPIPEFLLGEEENVSPEGQAKAGALKPECPGKGGTS